MSGPCEWPLSFVGCDDLSALDRLADRASVETMAAELLWNWTGRIFGACEVSVRPCRTNCRDYGGGVFRALSGVTPWYPVLVAGRWYNVTCGSCYGDCGCGLSTRSVVLPWPVAEVTEVVVDGEVVPADAYRLSHRKVLTRTDGQAWPTCQDLEALPGMPGTWEVTFVHGLAVPIGGQVAAGQLALEMAKALCNDGSCRLPQRVQNITRQGVTVTLMDAFDGLDKGRTGIWLVDSWVASVTRPRTGGTVHSVDLPRGRRYGAS